MQNCFICNSKFNVKYKDFYNTNLLKCSHCGFETQEKFPSEEELYKIYNSSYYDSWGDNENAVLQKKLYFKSVLDEVKLEKNSKILEIGCATGIFLQICKEEGYDLYGLDINEYGIEEAKKFIDSDKLFCCQFEELKIDTKFDAIFMFDYIEHVTNQEEVLSLAFERLNQNGQLIITTPSVSSITNKILNRKWPHYIQEHLSFFSKKSLQLLLNKIGFKNITVKSFCKIMTPSYFYSQVKMKKMYILNIVEPIYKLLSEKTKEKPIKIYTGDIISIAKK